MHGARRCADRRRSAAGSPHLGPERSRSGLVFPAPVSGGVVDTFSDIKAALVKADRAEG